ENNLKRISTILCSGNKCFNYHNRYRTISGVIFFKPGQVSVNFSTFWTQIVITDQMNPRTIVALKKRAEGGKYSKCWSSNLIIQMKAKSDVNQEVHDHDPNHNFKERTLLSF